MHKLAINGRFYEFFSFGKVLETHEMMFIWILSWVCCCLGDGGILFCVFTTVNENEKTKLGIWIWFKVGFGVDYANFWSVELYGKISSLIKHLKLEHEWVFFRYLKSSSLKNHQKLDHKLIEFDEVKASEFHLITKSITLNTIVGND
jgi:hypothetical protein